MKSDITAKLNICSINNRRGVSTPKGQLCINQYRSTLPVNLWIFILCTVGDIDVVGTRRSLESLQADIAKVRKAKKQAVREIELLQASLTDPLEIKLRSDKVLDQAVII